MTDPEAVANAALTCKPLHRALCDWPLPPGVPADFDPEMVSFAEEERVAIVWSNAAAKQAPEWRAKALRILLRQRALPPEDHKVMAKLGLVVDPWANAKEICEHLTELVGPTDGDYTLSLLALVVEAMPIEVEPERRPTGIMPESLRAARIAAFVDAKDPQLPLTLTGSEVGDLSTAPVQRPLFEFEAPATNLVPVLPLRFYRHAGGLDRTRGRGAPIAKRIWWSAIANTPIKYREPDGSIQLRTTLRELNDWLYPGQRWHPKKLDALRRGLCEADAIRVDWERREWRIVGVDALPNTTTKLDDPLLLRVAMPPGSDRGAMIALGMLYQCGTVSGPVFDAAIRLAYLWDAAKARNGGRRIYATRPKARRDRRGRLTDAAGKVLTGPDPSAPYTERRKVPAHQTASNWRDSRAVWSGEERNPAADHVPELDRRDLLRLFYGNDAPVGGMTERRTVQECRRMLHAHFETPGFVVLEERIRGRDFDAVRILQPRPANDA